MSAILDSLLLRRKPHATARAQMTVISGHGIINIFKILIDFGVPFQIRERYLEGHFNKFHESNAKAVAKLKLNSTAGNGTRRS